MLMFVPYFIFSLIFRSFLTFLFLVFNFVPFIRSRLVFERKNFFDVQEKYLEGEGQACACFLVSSEGELEQVLPLIEEYLNDKKKVEIVFTSESVEKKVLRFALDHPNLIFYKRLPLISFFPVPVLYFQSPWVFIKAKVIFFCRYDFYPELLTLGLFSKKLVLISGTLKNKKSTGAKAIFYRYFFSLFEKIYVTSDADFKKFKLLVDEKKLVLFDFRVSRILNRKEYARVKFQNIGIENFLLSMQADNGRKMIIGSGWESDLHLFANEETRKFLKKEQIALYFFPHKIKDENLINRVRTIFQSDFALISGLEELKHAKFESGFKIYYFDVAGILVEAYQYFSVAYIGGGFERSIHSVLEPYISGANIITGPKIYRSTEWDLINGDLIDPGGQVVVTSAELTRELSRRFLEPSNIKPSKNRLELLKWNGDQVKTHYLALQSFFKF